MKWKPYNYVKNKFDESDDEHDVTLKKKINVVVKTLTIKQTIKMSE